MRTTKLNIINTEDGDNVALDDGVMRLTILHTIEETNELRFNTEGEFILVLPNGRFFTCEVTNDHLAIEPACPEGEIDEISYIPKRASNLLDDEPVTHNSIRRVTVG